jgi:hypothetical protein
VAGEPAAAAAGAVVCLPMQQLGGPSGLPTQRTCSRMLGWHTCRTTWKATYARGCTRFTSCTSPLDCEWMLEQQLHEGSAYR